MENIVYGDGKFSLYEQLGDNRDLAKTGMIMLNNGFFRTICLYSSQVVNRVISRRTTRWVGIYLEPKSEVGSEIVLSCRLVFPLHEKPFDQTSVKQMSERGVQAQTTLGAKSNGELTLTLTGLVMQNSPVFIPRNVGLKPSWVIHNEANASFLLEYDAQNLVTYANVPAIYQVKKRL